MTAIAPAGTSASGAESLAKTRRNKKRSFITPEGTDLELEIASAGLRFAALVLDLIFMLIILIAATITLAYTSVGQAGNGDDVVFIVWLLGFFLLRNFWFIGFELGPRAATPGKRIVGIRVVARDGGQLTVASVVARNLVREVELFLPLSFIGGAATEEMVTAALAVMGLLWTLAMSLFLLFNRDRMRFGDLVGGTWVVVARRNKMARDLAVDGPAHPSEPQFTPEELSVYGVFELQELEKVLRRADAKAMMVVADTIRAKIGRPIIEEDRLFLFAYYRQARARMERDLLFGKRRENKYEAPA